MDRTIKILLKCILTAILIVVLLYVVLGLAALCFSLYISF